MAFDIFVMDWSIITGYTTVEEVFELQQRIWDKVLDTYEKTSKFLKPQTPYINDCALCTYAIIFDYKKDRCEMCPEDWSEHRACTKLNSLYERLKHGLIRDPEEMIKAIKVIRDVKPKEEFINGKR